MTDHEYVLVADLRSIRLARQVLGSITILPDGALQPIHRALAEIEQQLTDKVTEAMA